MNLAGTLGKYMYLLFIEEAIEFYCYVHIEAL